jgi:hypothetical protein
MMEAYLRKRLDSTVKEMDAISDKLNAADDAYFRTHKKAVSLLIEKRRSLLNVAYELATAIVEGKKS